MSKDRYSYVAVFSYEENGISIEFPDLPGCLPCADKDDTEGALKNAREALGLHIWGMEQDGELLPDPTPITELHLNANEVPALIEVFMPPIREKINSIPVILYSVSEFLQHFHFRIFVIFFISNILFTFSDCGGLLNQYKHG